MVGPHAEGLLEASVPGTRCFQGLLPRHGKPMPGPGRPALDAVPSAGRQGSAGH